jgi:PAS domain S-box-containing protein
MTNEPVANILIVDDDTKTLVAMEALLAGPGRKIVRAESGNEALRCLLREDFVLVLLDVRLPDMGGFETAALIRQRERLRYIPIIFLSAIDTLEDDVYRGVASGAVDYLFKPVVPQVLQAKVSVFIDLFRMNERLKQQAVRQTEERFRLVIESLRDYAVFMIDPQGRINMWNVGAERMGGWTQEEVMGESFARFYPLEDQAKDQPAHVLRKAALESRYEEEGWRVRKDGSQFWANIVITAIRNDENNLIGFSAVARDLTERKRTEEALKDSEQKLQRQAQELEQQLIASGRLVSVGELAASMAHEFNNPLGIVLGFAQDLLGKTDPAHASYRPLQIMIEEARRCEMLVRDLLEFARPRSDDFILTDVKELVAKTLEKVSNHLQKQNVEVIEKAAADLPALYADPRQLQQVLVNLCLNSLDAMPGGGKLTVGAHLNGSDHITVTVADTGFGIDAKSLPKIFQPFFTANKRRGLGLGLAICDRIVKAHGGRIEVESRVGQGTTFRIQLPLKQRTVERENAEKEFSSLEALPPQR